MKSFDLTATTSAVVEGDWTAHYRILDTVPGTILRPDPEGPRLVMTIDAETVVEAVMFVGGLCRLLDLEIVSVEATACDVEFAPVEYTGEQARQAAEWVRAASTLSVPRES